MKTNPNDISLVAIDGRKVLGFIRAIIDEKSAELVAMYVSPYYVGKGIGHTLWESISKILPTGIRIYVDVATYTAAVRFYKKIGFQDTGKRSSLCMTKDCKIVIPTMRLMRIL
jgi:ribosomal protein S18 acetylase RimI-like enzyme